MKNVIDFIFLLLRTILLLTVLGVLFGGALLVLLIVIPTQVLNAFAYLNEFLNSLGMG